MKEREDVVRNEAKEFGEALGKIADHWSVNKAIFWRGATDIYFIINQSIQGKQLAKKLGIR